MSILQFVTLKSPSRPKKLNGNINSKKSKKNLVKTGKFFLYKEYYFKNQRELYKNNPVNYNLYLAEDFAADESFIAFYLKTDQAAIIFWEEWISHHPEKIDEIFNAEQLLALMNIRLPDDELHEETNRFENFLHTSQPDKVSIHKQPLFRKPEIAIMLAILIIALFSVVLYFNNNSTTENITYITKHNGYGKISTLILNDGTKVTLNANSTIKFPKIFERKKRTITLIGEAFFEVAKDKSKPFTVEAKGTKTTVLGTEFNVSAYPSRPDVKVALLEGSVELLVNSGRDKILLKPSEMAIFSKKDKTLTRTTFNKQEITSWKEGLIIFRNASFSDIADKLKNTYGIELINKSGTTNWNYSGQFEKADYISIITSICFTRNLEFKQTNQTITLEQKNE